MIVSEVSSGILQAMCHKYIHATALLYIFSTLIFLSCVGCVTNQFMTLTASLSHQFVGFELVCFKRALLSTSFKLMARVWGGWISVVLVADSCCSKMNGACGEQRERDLGRRDNSNLIFTRLKVGR